MGLKVLSEDEHNASLIRDASQSLSIISREYQSQENYSMLKVLLPKTDFMECCTPYIMEFLNSYGSWILEDALGYTKIGNVRSQCNKVKMYSTAFFSKESSHDWLMNESMLDNKHSFQPSLALLPSPLAPRQRWITNQLRRFQMQNLWWSPTITALARIFAIECWS